MPGKLTQNRTVLGNWGIWEFGLTIGCTQVGQCSCSCESHKILDKLDPKQIIRFLKIHIVPCIKKIDMRLSCGIGWSVRRAGMMGHSLAVVLELR